LNNICIIPARGGSKRVPKKNLKNFLGFPIISYAIIVAKKSKLFSKIIVSTEDKEIAKISKKYGAEIHYRPKKLSDDITGTNAVICDVINSYQKKIKINIVCCIYPTSVFCTTIFLKKALTLLDKKTKYVFTASKYNHSIFRSFLKKKKISMLFPKKEKKRTQDLPPAYHDAAQFYFGWKESWLKNKSIFNKYSKFIEIDEHKTQDIDNLLDWKIAEAKYLKVKQR
jgi:pseudaminic acid cytidylyltransferase